MKRIIMGIMLCVMAVMKVAAIDVIASQVTIKDVTIDKSNFVVTVDAATADGNDVYEIAFDVWPATHSAIGSFSATDRSIKYTFSSVHQTKKNNQKVNIWYYGEYESAMSLTIVSNGDGTCTLSGSMEAADYNYTVETFVIAPFVFEYEEEPIDPDPGQDPYRFEPAEATTVDFVGDVVKFRDRETYIEVTLNEIANETYDWIELRLLSDTMDMPAGTYTIDDSDAAGTLTASKGYLGGTAGDDPCYVAIRADQESWGQYTPYYLASGSITVSYNDVGDTIFVTGTALSHNGTTVNINVKSYNMLFVDERPREPEHVILDIDTVVITYMSNLSDSTNNIFVYTFSFTLQDDYPQVLADILLTKPMELVEGTYTLEDGTIDGLILSQNQEDFEMNIFAGGAYYFTAATLTLTPAADGQWTYTMHMEDSIGSTYDFTLTQTPHIILYPEPGVDPEEEPYTDEQKEIATITIVLDTLVWDAKSVALDGIIDIYLTQLETDAYGLRAYVHLGMYTDVAYPESGTYPVNGSEENGSFSASLGRYGNVLIPCYVALMDENGYAYAIWYIVDGDITLSYGEGQTVLKGECKSYYGSTIIFEYQPRTQGIEEVQRNDGQCTKVLRDGHIYLMYEGRMYDVMGRPARY